MKKSLLAALALCCAGLAQAQASAQDGRPTVALGLKAWNTQWTTFGYDTNGGGQQVITQVPAKDKLVLVPLLSVRYLNFVGSISGYPSTEYEFVDGGSNTRKELDINLGYFVAPGVALTLGYKKVQQKDATNNYELAGPVAGVSATAPLSGGFALYGAYGLGAMKATGASTVKLDADYRLTEVGLAYNLALAGLPKALTFTTGYRTQVFTSKEASATQDGRDLTQGLTFGLVATF